MASKARKQAAPLTPQQQKDARTAARLSAARRAFLNTGTDNLTIRQRGVATKADDLDDRIKAAVHAYRAA